MNAQHFYFLEFGAACICRIAKTYARLSVSVAEKTHGGADFYKS